MSPSIQDQVDQYLETVGARLKERRESLQLSRKDLGSLFTPPFEEEEIGAIENGTEDLPLSEFVRICIFLKISPQKVLKRNLHPSQRVYPKGSAHYKAKLTEEQVFHIREMKGKAPLGALAEKYQVSHTTIHSIQVGRSWKHLLPEEE